ncbi:hypothetical protein AVEN_180062-1 [Araneus ventricosus]|uniref:Uncharacterized protein n=1 Tax=Araneus ventricosus TaxID=182803 RepID=A0A4Y2KF33_ARAVE|nr:hypothetical protein AVEN_180062-1 [Araneus ventricosus]
MGQLLLWTKSRPRPLLLGNTGMKVQQHVGFRFPKSAAVLLVDKAIQVKISLVRVPYVSNIDITLIHKLQHSVCEIIACINVIHTQGLTRLDLVGEHVKVVVHNTLRGHSSESTSGCNTENGCPGLL